MKRRLHYGWIVAVTCFFMLSITGGLGMAPLSLYIKPVADAIGCSRSGVSLVMGLAAFQYLYFQYAIWPLSEKTWVKKDDYVGPLSLRYCLYFIFLIQIAYDLLHRCFNIWFWVPHLHRIPWSLR